MDRETAETIFSEIESFASYAFNKSHAAAYATLAYQTAYLRRFYPQEYFSSLMSSVLGNTPKLQEYIDECQSLGIKILPPHVNYSGAGFTPHEGNIRYGLLAVKNLGRGLISRLQSERELNGKFKTFYEFCSRMSEKEINRRAIESLIKAGALDRLGSNRREMMMALPMIMDSLENDRKNNIEGQLGFFGTDDFENEMRIDPKPEYSERELLAMEHEITGMYISGHPMEQFRKAFETGYAARTDRIISSAKGESSYYRDGQNVRIIGIIESVKKKMTKSNTTMAFVTAEDMYSSIEILVFPNVFESSQNAMREGDTVEFSGRLSFTEEQEPKLVADSVRRVSSMSDIDLSRFKKSGSRTSDVNQPNGNRQAPPQSKKAVSNPGLYLRIKNNECREYEKALQYIDIFDGRADVYIYFTDSRKIVRAPARYRVDVNNVLIRELKKLLGDSNVALKE